MLGDSLSSVANTIATAALAFPLVREGGFSSEYRHSGSGFDAKIEIFHSTEKTGLERHVMKVTQKTYETGTDPERTTESYVVVRFSPGQKAEGELLAKAVMALFTAHGSNDYLPKVLGWES
jgi:hypothetical protein